MAYAENLLYSSSWLRQRVKRWARIWKVPGIERRIQISFNARLKSSLGRSDIRKGVVSLNLSLKQQTRQKFLEVVCHEVAHFAVFELYGKNAKPHGSEWRHLMDIAGFEPSTFICINKKQAELINTRKSEWIFEHRCPVCQMVRFSSKAVSRWKCGDCVRAGLDGHLIVTKRPKTGKKK